MRRRRANGTMQPTAKGTQGTTTHPTRSSSSSRRLKLGTRQDFVNIEQRPRFFSSVQRRSCFGQPDSSALRWECAEITLRLGVRQWYVFELDQSEFGFGPSTSGGRPRHLSVVKQSAGITFKFPHLLQTLTSEQFGKVSEKLKRLDWSWHQTMPRAFLITHRRYNGEGTEHRGKQRTGYF